MRYAFIGNTRFIQEKTSQKPRKNLAKTKPGLVFFCFCRVENLTPRCFVFAENLTQTSHCFVHLSWRFVFVRFLRGFFARFFPVRERRLTPEHFGRMGGNLGSSTWEAWRLLACRLVGFFLYFFAPLLTCFSCYCILFLIIISFWYWYRSCQNLSSAVCLSSSLLAAFRAFRSWLQFLI